MLMKKINSEYLISHFYYHTPYQVYLIIQKIFFLYGGSVKLLKSFCCQGLNGKIEPSRLMTILDL